MTKPSNDNHANSQCPVNHSSNGCPVDHSKQDTSNNSSTNSSTNSLFDRTEHPSLWNTFQATWSDWSNNTSTAPPPASVEQAAAHSQEQQQAFPLATDRQISSIPRGQNEAAPAHQQGISNSSSNWLYPSEQQLYNAMRRKGWNPPASSIPVVLQLHNGLNERTWQQVCEYEGRSDLQLVRFTGRPVDLTPKAFLFSKLLRLYDVPFDRHDWYVQSSSSSNNNNKPQRYVIDYYYLPATAPDQPPIPYVDVRPAIVGPGSLLLSTRAVYLQTCRWCTTVLPGWTAYYRRYFGSDGRP